MLISLKSLGFEELCYIETTKVKKVYFEVSSMRHCVVDDQGERTYSEVVKPPPIPEILGRIRMTIDACNGICTGSEEYTKQLKEAVGWNQMDFSDVPDWIDARGASPPVTR